MRGGSRLLHKTVFTSEYFSAYAVSASSCQTNCHRAVTTEPKKGKNRELTNTHSLSCVSDIQRSDCAPAPHL